MCAFQNPDIVLVHYLNVPYPDDNKLAVITPSLALWGDKKEWTKEELVSQLKPMCESPSAPCTSSTSSTSSASYSSGAGVSQGEVNTDLCCLLHRPLSLLHGLLLSRISLLLASSNISHLLSQSQVLFYLGIYFSLIMTDVARYKVRFTTVITLYSSFKSCSRYFFKTHFDVIHIFWFVLLCILVGECRSGGT